MRGPIRQAKANRRSPHPRPAHRSGVAQIPSGAWPPPRQTDSSPEKWSLNRLFCRGIWNTGFVCLFRQIGEFGVGLIQSLLLVSNLLFVLRLFRFPISRSPQAIADIGEVRVGSQLVFAPGNVKLAR